eukprot:Awhi_evm1s15044
MADSNNYRTGDLNLVHVTYDPLFIERLLFYATFCYTIAEQCFLDDINSTAPDVQEFDLNNVEESELDKERRFNLLEEANVRLGKALDDVIRSAYVTVSGDEHLRPIPESKFIVVSQARAKN